jgi:hypothetical protein
MFSSGALSPLESKRNCRINLGCGNSRLIPTALVVDSSKKAGAPPLDPALLHRSFITAVGISTNKHLFAEQRYCRRRHAVTRMRATHDGGRGAKPSAFSHASKMLHPVTPRSRMWLTVNAIEPVEMAWRARCYLYFRNGYFGWPERLALCGYSSVNIIARTPWHKMLTIKLPNITMTPQSRTAPQRNIMARAIMTLHISTQKMRKPIRPARTTNRARLSPKAARRPPRLPNTRHR